VFKSAVGNRLVHVAQRSGSQAFADPTAGTASMRCSTAFRRPCRWSNWKIAGAAVMSGNASSFDVPTVAEAVSAEANNGLHVCAQRHPACRDCHLAKVDPDRRSRQLK
jgi:hypothetical protein